MSERDHRITLHQINEYIEHAQALCMDKSAAQIQADWRIALAFERALEVIGEAVKRLPEELKLRHPEIPWRLIAGMRDKLSHGYDSVDYQLLWDAVQNDLPSLRATVQQIISEMGKPLAS